jgi:2-octaprenyl-6-methoxyphenol hydroxylase
MNQTLPYAPPAPLSVAVIGAGPVGLALALQAARTLPDARISVFDKRPLAHDVAADPRTLALSLGSVQEFERLGVWRAIEPAACAITTVHVSQQQPSMLLAGLAAALGAARAGAEPELLITAGECGVDQLGAVASYGAIVAPLQAAWLAEVAREPQRLSARLGAEVAGLKGVAGGVEVDAGIAEVFDLAVVAEGGVFSAQARKAVTHDYGQTAWVGQVTFATAPDAARAGTAYERFTPHGPAALLPLPGRGGAARAALVWCVDSADDPVRELDDGQRLAVLNSVFHARVGRLAGITALKAFPLGLNAERTLVERPSVSEGDATGPRRVVRIGNAAQTLHPVAGQGLNLGLRDAHALVAALRRHADVDTALRRVEWQRAPDRWALIAATDFLARSFTWRLPGLASARGLGLAALQALGPAKRAVAQQMMFGMR